MKDKIIGIGKNILIGLGVLFIFSIGLAVIIGVDDEEIAVTVDNTAPEAQNKPVEAVKPAVITMTIDGKDVDFDGYRDASIPVLNKPDEPLDRAGQVSRYDKVELIEQHANRLYCKIRKENIEGYIACYWLKEAPQEWKDLWEI